MRFALVLVVLAGCSTTSPYKRLSNAPAEYGISRWEDDNTICIIYRDKDQSSLQCTWKKK